ncbi:hypothetical protein [Novosphingobium sp. HII-3]|uniref:hypothetical protein n=1 Tax=Novosphingobium sp. HII-3 TaxID=2075565 RepID=UPI000CDA63F3|nr:hypothetical protein [Novosphingobium sp. HII-3]
MTAQVIAFPRARVTPSASTFEMSIEQCVRLEQRYADAGDWEQAAFFMKAARILTLEARYGRKTANDNVVPLRRA